MPVGIEIGAAAGGSRRASSRGSACCAPVSALASLGLGEGLERAPHALRERDAAEERAHRRAGRRCTRRAARAWSPPTRGGRRRPWRSRAARSRPRARPACWRTCAARGRSPSASRRSPRLGEQRAHGRLDVLAADAVERDLITEGEQGIVDGRAGHGFLNLSGANGLGRAPRERGLCQYVRPTALRGNVGAALAALQRVEDLEGT